VWVGKSEKVDVAVSGPVTPEADDGGSGANSGKRPTTDIALRTAVAAQPSFAGIMRTVGFIAPASRRNGFAPRSMSGPDL